MCLWHDFHSLLVYTLTWMLIHPFPRAHKPAAFAGAGRWVLRMVNGVPVGGVVVGETLGFVVGPVVDGDAVGDRTVRPIHGMSFASGSATDGAVSVGIVDISRYRR
mmetsp:Transcript_15195/g.28837  ORF Transcript_15195/g.28837 Transcript_15195/m.28837 type:complete len:106 (+) Transcript_15195:1130-1447(+)